MRLRGSARSKTGTPGVTYCLYVGGAWLGYFSIWRTISGCCWSFIGWSVKRYSPFHST